MNKRKRNSLSRIVNGGPFSKEDDAFITLWADKHPTKTDWVGCGARLGGRTGRFNLARIHTHTCRLTCHVGTPAHMHAHSSAFMHTSIHMLMHTHPRTPQDTHITLTMSIYRAPSQSHAPSSSFTGSILCTHTQLGTPRSLTHMCMHTCRQGSQR